MKKIIFIFILFIFSFCSAFGAEEKNVVRVGISNSSFSSYEHSFMEFTSEGFFSAQDILSGKIAEFSPNDTVLAKFENGVFNLSVEDKVKLENVKGSIVLTSSDKIGIKGLNRKGNPAFYRGMIELVPVKSNKFNIVNILSMQDYLKGVVPNEMPVSFGIEALKAQAVAARNYANRPNSFYKNYDVCDSTACQVYYGANSQTRISDRAVDETLGIYAMYDNELILALYSSTASGITENYFSTFGNETEKKPYLISIRDADKLSRLDDEEYFKTKPPSFDINSPKYRWNIEFTREELQNTLSKTLLEQSKAGNVSPEFKNGEKISEILDIKILKKGASRKILALEIKTKSNNYIVSRELPIRKTFKKDGKILPSANFIIEKEDENKEPSKFKFYGAGFGHGVGMSQFGAGYLSGLGVPYEGILKHYYNGINLGTIPKTVAYNEAKIPYTQEFYFNKSEKPARVSLFGNPLRHEVENILSSVSKPNCYLIIENKDKVSNLNFSINEYKFSQSMKDFKKKILKTDITKYLKTGINRLIFEPVPFAERKKTVKFYLIFGGNNE